MKKFAHFALAAALTLYAGLASAATFNLFQPANGILVGNPNTYVTTAATSSNVIALWSGTCNASSFLRGDGTCNSVAVPSGANPTASVGLTAVNGVATTFMRSDGAPALSQSIVPTWTGAHTFTQSPLLQASAPRLRYNATGAGVDEKQWAVQIFSTGTFSLNTRTDIDGSGADALTITRTGTAINTVGWNAATFQVNASTATNFSNASSTNTFAGDSTFQNNVLLNTLAGTAASPNLQITSASPNFALFENDATADNGLWVQRPVAEQLRFSSCTDSGGTCADYMRVDRTASAVDTIQLDAGSNGIDVGATAIAAIAGLEAGPQVLINSTNPSLYVNDSDATADNRLWRFGTPTSNQLDFQTRNDANNSGVSWLTVARTGTSIGVIGFPTSSGITVGAPSGGAQGNGTINATGLFVNGVAVGVGSGDAVLANNQSFTGNNTFTNTGNNVQGTVPQWGWRETGATADEGNWLIRADGNQFSLFTATDAAPTSAAGTVVAFGRSGTTASTADFFSGGTVQLTNSGFVIGNSTSPRFTLNETDAAVDNRLWRIGTSAETLVWGARNDADNAGTDFLLVDRTGTAIDDITLQSDRLLLRTDGSQAADFIIDDTASAADEEIWRFRANGAGQLQLGAVNDALSVANNFLTVDRTGATIDSITFGGPTIFPANAASHTFQATSTLSANIVLNNANAPSDEKNLILRTSSSGPFVISSSTDAAPANAVNNLLVADRTGTTFDTFAISATSVSINGGSITPSTGTFNVDNHSGGTCTVAYNAIGPIVVLKIGTAGTCTGTSGSTGGPFSCTGCVPTSIRPTTQVIGPIRILNNSVGGFGMIRVNSSGDINSGCGADVGAGCTASGSKGVSPATNYAYNTQ